MGDAETVKTAPEGYEFDVQGNLVHLVYDEGGHASLGIKGTVVPSAKIGGNVGGNVAFDPETADIPQNIVECTDEGMKVIAQTTRAEMAKKQGIPAQPAQGVPAETPFQGQAPGQLMGGALGQLSISLSNRGGDMAKKKAKKKPSKTSSRRGEKTPEAVPLVAPVPVTLSGAFGQIVQPFTAVFRDGNLVVLATDHRQLPVAYKFPPLPDDKPMPIQIGWAGQAVQCLWAGISFTLPDRSVTFSLLFANEEQPNGERLPSEARQD